MPLFSGISNLEASSDDNPWRLLLWALSTPTSACLILQPRHVAIAKELAQGKVLYECGSAEQVKAFKDDCQLFYSVCADYNHTWPEFARPFLLDFIVVAELPFKDKPLPVDPEKPLEEIDPYLSLHVWDLPLLRQRMRYAIDAVDPEEERACRKETTTDWRGRNQTHGICTCVCSHGVAYGFHMMLSGEGRTDVFHQMVTRFPQRMLDKLTVAYDFACNLAEYCLNREPMMFRNVRWVVDRFHQANHTCGPTFNMNKYNSLNNVISTGMESLNSVLERHRAPLSYMAQQRWALCSHTIIGRFNDAKNTRMMQQMTPISE
eukprot:TRINITY_DN19582_c0_g1_i1.p1 TRINITY_DN19582_c0_g1~~TRINITY_DN19582_c0_g1_i1.p1  ORF type:complete len:371 (+),score=60.34 TRINITY_DN19582_c0_g1_i1:158-1114(+)